MKERKQHRRSCEQGYGGLPSMRTRRNISRIVTFSIEIPSQSDDIPFNL
jgi:hypothetical protein